MTAAHQTTRSMHAKAVVARAVLGMAGALFMAGCDQGDSAKHPSSKAPASGADSAAVAADAEALPQLSLDARWQLQPRAIRTVYVGPDDRTWLRDQTIELEKASIQARIQEQFDKPAPVIPADIVLFEPGGRVWFQINAGRKTPTLLAGYDGKRWMEIPGPYPANQYDLPGHETTKGKALAAFADGKTFLPVGTSVHIVHGRQVSAEKLFEPRSVANPPASAPQKGIRLLPELDGKGVVAICPFSEWPVMRWRDGKWKPVGVPLNAFAEIEAAAVDEAGVWLMSPPGPRLFYARFDAPVRTVVDVANDMQSGDMAVVNTAFEELVATGLDGRLLMNPVAREHKVYELLGRMKVPETPHIALPFGPYQVSHARYLHQTTTGHIFLAAERISGDGAPTPGVLVRLPSGEIRMLAGEEMLRAWSGRQPPIAAGQNRFWVRNDVGDAAMLFDLETGKAVARSADVAATITSARKDGTMFSRVGNGCMSFSPGQPESHQMISSRWEEATNWALWGQNDQFWFDDGDRIVAGWKGLKKGSARFEFADGVRGIVAAEGDSLLVRRASGFELVKSDGTRVFEPSLNKLIEQNLDDIRRISAAPLAGPGWTRILTDSSGRVWAMDSYAPPAKLNVLIDGKWVDVARLLNGLGLSLMQPSGIMPVGSRMLIWGSSRTGQGAWLVQLNDAGEASFETAPLPLDDGPFLRAPDGEMWYVARRLKAQGYDVCRTQGDGIQVVAPGRLLAVGERGALIVDEFGADDLELWRDGKAIAKLEVAGKWHGAAAVEVEPGRFLFSAGTYLRELLVSESGQLAWGRLVASDIAMPAPEMMRRTAPGEVMIGRKQPGRLIWVLNWFEYP